MEVSISVMAASIVLGRRALYALAPRSSYAIGEESVQSCNVPWETRTLAAAAARPVAPPRTDPSTKVLLKAGMLHGDCMTITGETWLRALLTCPTRRAWIGRLSAPPTRLRTTKSDDAFSLKRITRAERL